MSFAGALPVLVLSTSLLAGVVILCVREEARRIRGVANLSAAALKLALVGIMLWAIARGERFETRLPFLPGMPFLLIGDPFAMLLSTLSAVLWLVTTVYAIGYMEPLPPSRRFFGFFSLCVTATMGVALAGNPLTFLLFYEMLTLSTYPLVVHAGTAEALRAGRIYLAYTVAGGALLLLGIAWLHRVAGPVEFATGGALHAVPDGAVPRLVPIFVLLVAGLGVKTALVPLHGWLPAAMVAPAPVSALLHAVAVVKAGAFGIVRVVYDLYGIRLADQLGVLRPLAAAAAVTILHGSVRALLETNLKRRLAFSTVSQVSYIVLGVAIFGPLTTVGGIVHLVHQGLMKVTLFFCAGILARQAGVHDVRQMKGLGRRLPLTMAAFTVGALGMIGLPPLAGFVTKWYLGVGASGAGAPWAVAVLAASTVLNAAYFLPIVRDAWFAPGPGAAGPAPSRGREADPRLLVPALVTALLSIAAGLFAGSAASPLRWAERIGVEEFYR